MSHMKTGRIRCFAAVLPDSHLIVVAGGILSDTVEIASVKVPFNCVGVSVRNG